MAVNQAEAVESELRKLVQKHPTLFDRDGAASAAALAGRRDKRAMKGTAADARSGDHSLGARAWAESLDGFGQLAESQKERPGRESYRSRRAAAIAYPSGCAWGGTGPFGHDPTRASGRLLLGFYHTKT